MANLISIGGNFGTAGSWGVADTTMLKTDGATSTNVDTTNKDSTGYVPGAITVDGILLNMSSISSTSGTMTVSLRNSTDNLQIDAVTVNTADLPAFGQATDSPGCWLFFKFGTNRTLTAGKTYKVRVTASTTNPLALYAGASNAWNLMLRTTTTGAPAAADNMYIQKEMTGAGTSNAVTVTMDNNNTNAYGLINITQAALQYSTSGNTQLRLADNIHVWPGGIFSQGTSVTPIPQGTVAILEWSTTGKGLTMRTGSTVNLYGANKTYWKTFLNSDAAAGATSLTVEDSIGSNWKNGDSIALASTTRTPSQSEKKALSADGSGTTLTIAAISNDHSGTAPTKAEVCNLTRSCQVQGTSGSIACYIYQKGGTLNASWAEFLQMGGGTSNQRGINIGTVASIVTSIQNCSLHDGNSGSANIFINSALNAAASVTISNNAFYNNVTHLNHGQPTTASCTIDGNIFMLASNTYGVVYGSVTATFTNNTFISNTGASGGGLQLSDTAGIIGTMSGNVAHSNTGAGVAVNNIPYGTISDTTCWRNASSGINFSISGALAQPLILDGVTAFGNGSANILLGATISGELLLKNLTLDAGATLTCPVGIIFNSGNMSGVRIIDSELGATTTHATADIQIVQAWLNDIFLYNTTLSSGTPVLGQTNLGVSIPVAIRSSRHGGVAGDYKSWFRYGNINNDTSTYKTAAPSEKMVPNNATYKLESAKKTVALLDGQSATVSVWVRRSVAGANPPRLIAKANYGAGMTGDYTLNTMSVGVDEWEQISGGTADVTEDCVLEFVVDSDSGNGNIWVDDWSVIID